MNTLPKNNLIHRVKALFLALTLSVASHAFADADFDRIPQDSNAQSSNNSSIIPYEPMYSTFAVANEGKKGALVSLGSFRALTAASQGQFDYAILMDSNPKLVEFNRKQIELLKTSATVEQFLAKILEQPELTPLINSALRGNYRALYQLESKVLANYTAESLISKNYVLKILEISKFDENTTFLTDVNRFAQLKKLAVAGKMLAIAGDLTGTQTLVQVGEWLKARGVAVSVLDTSNAQTAIVKDKALLAQFIRNLSSLPWMTGAVVNFTETIGQRLTDAEKQRYRLTLPQVGPPLSHYSLAQENFIQGIKDVANTSESYAFQAYIHFIYKMKYTSSDLHHQAFVRRKDSAWKCESSFR